MLGIEPTISSAVCVMIRQRGTVQRDLIESPGEAPGAATLAPRALEPFGERVAHRLGQALAGELSDLPRQAVGLGILEAQRRDASFLETAATFQTTDRPLSPGPSVAWKSPGFLRASPEDPRSPMRGVLYRAAISSKERSRAAWS
jgi:hypothetical protein